MGPLVFFAKISGGNGKHREKICIFHHRRRIFPVGPRHNTLPRCRRSTVSNLLVRLIQKMHYPRKNPSGRKRDSCIVCSNRQLRNRKQTRMICKQSTYPMCIGHCFENYYTLHLAYIYGKTMDPC